MSQDVIKFDLDKAVESRLNLQPNAKMFDGLCMVTIESVKLEMYKVATEDKKGSESTSEFKGMEVPRLVIVSRNVLLSDDDVDRYNVDSWGVIASQKKDGSAIAKDVLQSLYQGMYGKIMHYLNAFKDESNFVKITSLPDIDPFAIAEVRIKQMTEFFKTFETAFNKGIDGKPIYTDVKCWLKIIADYKKGTHYVTPEFVGQGFIETVKFDGAGKPKPSIIKIKPGEKITLNMIDNKDAKPSNLKTEEEDFSSLPPEVRAALGK